VRPIIGLNCDFEHTKPQRRKHSFIYPEYYDAVVRTGGLPMLLPPLNEPDELGALLDRVDGFVLTGGDDLDPEPLGLPPHPEVTPVHPRREASDWMLVRALLERPLPVLAICLGLQQLNILAGGTIHVHIDDADQVHRLPGKPTRHTIEVAEGTRLHAICGSAELEVLSHHHQAIDLVAPGWRACAVAPDGFIEAIEPESPERFILGVQWHPESAESQLDQQLFDALVSAARSRREKVPGTICAKHPSGPAGQMVPGTFSRPQG